jgi:cation diffusion facilitator CzcD-associated flavoprotein CzcO
VSFAGKRVGVIGTGATGVQVITEIAKDVGHLVVFQRTPGYAAPLRNTPIDAETQTKLKENYADIFDTCRNSIYGFVHDHDSRSALDVADEERLATYEELYTKRGFAKLYGNFRDILSNQQVNDEFSDFLKAKIRERVTDPGVAEQLIPMNHGFGARRPPFESGYYEVFNQPNVELANVRESPIEQITATGIRTAAREYDLDMIVIATGFDLMTGSLFRIDWTGQEGRQLEDHWSAGPRTYMNMQVAGFPNMFLVMGAGLGNWTRAAEQNVEWVTECIRYMQEHGYDRVSTSTEAENGWIKTVWDLMKDTPASKLEREYHFGTNIPGKPKAFYGGYPGGFAKFRQICDSVVASDYEGFVFSQSDQPSGTPEFTAT